MNKLLIFFLFWGSTTFGQDQKLAKFLGPDFQSIPARASIPYRETAAEIEIIPSNTIAGDTSGLVYQNEYLLFRNYEPDQKGTASYVKTTFVSNKEFREFQDWVRDSTAREKIIAYSERIEPVLKFMNYSQKELEGEDEIDRSRNLHELRQKHTLNWKTEFKYDDPQWMPFLADMYLPQPERFCKSRDFDNRKLHYRYFTGPDQMECFTSTIAYPEFWANKSKSVNDQYAVLGQLYMSFLPQLPVIGLTGMQAHAFCHWKEMQLQNELNKKHLPYKVRVTLPFMSELTKIPVAIAVPERDYTTQWRITVENYRTFMLAVKDSIVTEHLFYQLQEYKSTRADALKLIAYKETYFDENSQKMRKMDPSDNELCRYICPLKKDAGIFKKYREQVQEIEKNQEGHLDFYKYYRMDVRAKTIIGALVPEDHGPNYKPAVSALTTRDLDSITGEPVGMDLNLDYFTKLGNGNGVRGHENYSRFILREQVAITPEIPLENQQPNELVKGITYEQALAYYHWKYPVSKTQPKEETWQDYVFPSEEQFREIQKGTQITIPEHALNFPSPVFRYVVTFLPAK
ncbi:hypothetical protein D3C87_309170 [compost metagenome]